MSQISRTWTYATVLIYNQWNQFGTGFLVQRSIDEKSAKIFLVTNKHVLNKNIAQRQSATHIICHMNKKSANGEIKGVEINFPLVYSGTSNKNWKEHPNEYIDILAIDITQLIINNPDLEKKYVDYSLFVTPEIIKSEDLTIGEDIMVLGYPSSFKQGDTNFPIVRQGIIASQLGQIYIDKTLQDTQGKIIERQIPGFLIDGGLIPGSSGSPVVLKPVIGRLKHDTIEMSVPQPYLLGIVAETRFAPIQLTPTLHTLGYADLGLAFDATKIKETIELFFP
jgi:hypothetical protein